MIGEFDWDERKARSNLKKHGVSFEQAVFAFYDEYALIDTDEHDDEVRYRLIGATDAGVLFVVYVELEGDVIRIISARGATRREKENYEQRKAVRF